MESSTYQRPSPNFLCIIVPFCTIHIQATRASSIIGAGHRRFGVHRAPLEADQPVPLVVLVDLAAVGRRGDVSDIATHYGMSARISIQRTVLSFVRGSSAQSKHSQVSPPASSRTP